MVSGLPPLSCSLANILWKICLHTDFACRIIPPGHLQIPIRTYQTPPSPIHSLTLSPTRLCCRITPSPDLKERKILRAIAAMALNARSRDASAQVSLLCFTAIPSQRPGRGRLLRPHESFISGFIYRINLMDDRKLSKEEARLSNEIAQLWK
jgi:hypothetical protein